ncbi:MAG: DoxX family protein [Woeseiaceae bacterium]
MSSKANVEHAALLLRAALGSMFIAHGLLKLFVFTLPGTVQFFEQVGLPGFLAYVVTGTEVAGGILLILGIATRWVSLALLPVLLGAVSVHFGAGWLFTNPTGGWEYPAFLTVAAVVQALLGDGAHALRLPVNPLAAPARH